MTVTVVIKEGVVSVSGAERVDIEGVAVWAQEDAMSDFVRALTGHKAQSIPPDGLEGAA